MNRYNHDHYMIKQLISKWMEIVVLHFIFADDVSFLLFLLFHRIDDDLFVWNSNSSLCCVFILLLFWMCFLPSNDWKKRKKINGDIKLSSTYCRYTTNIDHQCGLNIVQEISAQSIKKHNVSNIYQVQIFFFKYCVRFVEKHNFFCFIFIFCCSLMVNWIKNWKIRYGAVECKFVWFWGSFENSIFTSCEWIAKHFNEILSKNFFFTLTLSVCAVGLTVCWKRLLS